ncbi:MAG: hypothetical protein O7E53_07450 [Alphaproteobacteria bacterium]|nr:hypothetical protein [Alphaproteobacteria bacterium]
MALRLSRAGKGPSAMTIPEPMPRAGETLASDQPAAGWNRYVFSYPLVAAAFFLLFVYLGVVSGKGGSALDLLKGPDDMMRVVQVLDWLGGKNWFDTVQKRLDPPARVPMHWSRLSDLPLAVGISTFRLFAGHDQSVYLAVLLVPAFLAGLFAAVFVWAAVPLVGRQPILVPILMIGTIIIPIQQFVPGRVDHHGLQLILALAACGFLIRAILLENGVWAMGLGFVGGLSLAIGLEALPLLGAGTIALCLGWIWQKRQSAPALALFGMALWVTVLVLIPVTQPPDRWTASLCDQMSVVYLALTGIVPVAGAAALSLGYWAKGLGRSLRLVIMAGIGMAGLAAVVMIFPDCARGPYGNLPQGVMYWLRKVSEAEPLLAYAWKQPGSALAYVILPLMAFAYTAWQSVRADNTSRPLWLALCVLAVSGLAVVTWQIRGSSYAGTLAGLVLMPLAAALNRRADRSINILARVGLRVCLPLLSVVVILACFNIGQSPKPSHVAQRRATCDVRLIATALNDPKGLGAAPITIAAPIFVGPLILFLTRHRVITGPYHRNIRGLIDNRRIFSGSEAEALDTIKRRDVKAILFCTKYARFSRYPGRAPFLAARLMAGDPPGWLTPIMIGKGFGLYAVKRSATGGQR